MRNDICILITDMPNGNQIESIETEVWCEKTSCTRSEFYQAYAVGQNPKYNLDIDLWDFEDASVVKDGERLYPVKVKYGDVIYNILRTYEKDNLTVSLTVG